MHSFSSALLNTFLIVALLWLIVPVIVLVTLARRRDILAPVRYFWAAVILFAPVVGLVIYLLYGLKKHNKRLQ